MRSRPTKATASAGDALPPAGSGWPEEGARGLGAGPAPQDDIDRDIATLKALHPEIEIRFRQDDLAHMSRHTKRLLLEQMRELLGIEKLSRTDL